MSGDIVRLYKCLYGLKQASCMWHAHFITCLKNLVFEQCQADVRVFHLIEDAYVAITAVVQVEDIFAVGRKDKSDRLYMDLNGMIPVNTLGELK